MNFRVGENTKTTKVIYLEVNSLSFYNNINGRPAYNIMEVVLSMPPSYHKILVDEQVVGSGEMRL